MTSGKESSLRSKLLGAWELLEYCTYLPSDESDKKYPAGKDAKGIIMYTEDGYMSAQVQDPGQKTFGEDRGAGTESEWAELAHRFTAYTGRFNLHEAGDEGGRPILVHHADISNMPYLCGNEQRRLIEIVGEGDGRRLVLRTEQPVSQNSKEVRSARVTWRRMPVNQAPQSS